MLKFNILLLSFALPRILASVHSYTKDTAYDAGTYGEHPINTYSSSPIVSPSLNILQWDQECDDGLYIMLTPRGDAVRQPGAMILDSKGQLVWFKGGYHQVYNLQVQMWDGERYLTFWAGNDAVDGHGAGHYYVLDSSYNEILKMSAARGVLGDLHDFQLTEQGTAIVIVYEVISADLSSPGDIAEGVIWDCLIQEISLATQSLIFQWRSSSHYKVSDSYRDIGTAGTFDQPFDYIHINSVAKDPAGNYLVSSRYTHSLTYVSGETGKVLWVLGGKRNNFADLSDGHATNFAYQHDARFLDPNTITLFDNSADDEHKTHPYSRGVKIRLDFEYMTAELVTEYINPRKISSISQGSMQILPSSNVLLGYGNSAAWTQFSDNGTVLCDVHFAPGEQFGWSEVQSYRVRKYEWRGYPTTRPDVKMEERRVGEGNRTRTSVAVSWNGDTEVRRWVLQGAMWNESIYGGWKDLRSVERVGFETVFELEEVGVQFLRVKGLDMEGEILGVSEALETGHSVVFNFKSWAKSVEKPSPTNFLWGFLLCTTAFVMWKEYRMYRSRVDLERRNFELPKWYLLEGTIRIE